MRPQDVVVLLDSPVAQVYKIVIQTIDGGSKDAPGRVDEGHESSAAPVESFPASSRLASRPRMSGHRQGEDAGTFPHPVRFALAVYVSASGRAPNGIPP